jgi:hypothetical protein
LLTSAKARAAAVAADPLLKQQVEWNVKQESGHRLRAILFGVRHYPGRKFKSLSVAPANDVKDMTSLLRKGNSQFTYYLYLYLSSI